MHLPSQFLEFSSASDYWSETPNIRYSVIKPFASSAARHFNVYDCTWFLNTSTFIILVQQKIQNNNCLFYLLPVLENPPSTSRHHFTRQGNISQQLFHMSEQAAHCDLYVNLLISFSIWSLSLPCTYLVVNRHLLCRSWSQWPVSNLKTISQNSTDNVSLVYALISAGFVHCSADMFQKLSAVENQRVWVIESGAHRVSDK